MRQGRYSQSTLLQPWMGTCAHIPSVTCSWLSPLPCRLSACSAGNTIAATCRELSFICQTRVTPSQHATTSITSLLLFESSSSEDGAVVYISRNHLGSIRRTSVTEDWSWLKIQKRHARKKNGAANHQATKQPQSKPCFPFPARVLAVCWHIVISFPAHVVLRIACSAWNCAGDLQTKTEGAEAERADAPSFSRSTLGLSALDAALTWSNPPRRRVSAAWRRDGRCAGRSR